MQYIFDWKSAHGGNEFDDLIDKKGRSVLWLHDFDYEDHPRFRGADVKDKGVGLSIYALVENLDQVYKRCQEHELEIIEELHLNPNAKFREFTFKLKEGYQFSACEKGPYLNI